MKVILMILVGCMFTSAESACECSDVTLQDERDGEIGRCESKLGGKFWCYVSSNSECMDKKESSRQAGLFWSHEACSEKKDKSRDSRTRNLVCVTVGGDDTGATCVFPFIYQGKSYSGCTLENADDGIPWCSTQVDGEGVHVGKQGNWGHCGQGCPTDLGSDISPVDSDCQCSDVTLQDDTDGEIGRCESKLGGKFWCYVSTNSGCSDKKESSRQANLFWSHKACGVKVSNGQSTIRGNDISPGPADSACECSDVTLQDDTEGEIGRCESKLGGKFWCYVSSYSGCSDKKESSRQADLFWSHLACSKKPDTRLGITKGAANSCKTVGGDDVGAACVFLFIHKDKFYTGCTLDGATDGKPWCSTQVDAQGVHATGQGKWGHCGQGCPTHSGTSVNAVVQEPDLNTAKSPILRSANCLRVEGYWKYWNYGVEYPGNDIRPCHLNKKSSASECQRFCQTVPGCVGWEWGYDGNNCCAKSTMDNRATGKAGRIAGLYNSCEPAVSTGGCFTSTGYPNNYPNQGANRHVIRVAPGQKIEVTFNDFELEDHPSCGYDYLELYDELHLPIDRKYCGKLNYQTLLPLSTSTVTAVFQSDGSVTKKGYKICYKPVGVPSSSDCVKSPGHPNDYPDGFHKIETLTVAAGKHIEITFHHFDIEAHTSCAYDYLQFVGETEKLCGNTLPEKLTIASNTARVLFHSDGGVRRKGYKFCYKPVPAVAPNGLDFQCSFDDNELVPSASGRSNFGTVSPLPVYVWQNGEIPYYFNPTTSSGDKALIENAMKMIEVRTCFRFLKLNREPPRNKHHLEIKVKDTSCANRGFNAGVGKISRYKLLLESKYQLTGSDCSDYTAGILHELMHVLGVMHTQKRVDRLQHIRINWGNIEDNFPARYQYDVCKDCNSYGVKYDCSSIMHYGTGTLSKEKILTKPTMTAKDSSECELTWDGAAFDGRGASENDWKLLNIISKNVCPDSVRVPTGSISLDADYWGEWGDIETCEYPHFANKMELKIESPGGDDTSLNGIRLTCNDGNTISSSVHQWGTWRGVKECFQGFIDEVQIRRESRLGNGDDTGGNGIRFRCTGSGTIYKPGDGNWGDWSSWQACESGSAVYGIQTRVERCDNCDDTALNDVIFLCAKLP